MLSVIARLHAKLKQFGIATKLLRIPWKFFHIPVAASILVFSEVNVLQSRSGHPTRRL